MKQYNPVEMQVKTQAQNPSRKNYFLACVILVLSQVSLLLALHCFPVALFPFPGRY